MVPNMYLPCTNAFRACSTSIVIHLDENIHYPGTRTRCAQGKRLVQIFFIAFSTPLFFVFERGLRELSQDNQVSVDLDGCNGIRAFEFRPFRGFAERAFRRTKYCSGDPSLAPLGETYMSASDMRWTCYVGSAMTKFVNKE